MFLDQLVPVTSFSNVSATPSPAQSALPSPLSTPNTLCTHLPSFKSMSSPLFSATRLRHYLIVSRAARSPSRKPSPLSYQQMSVYSSRRFLFVVTRPAGQGIDRGSIHSHKGPDQESTKAVRQSSTLASLIDLETYIFPPPPHRSAYHPHGDRRASGHPLMLRHVAGFWQCLLPEIRHHQTSAAQGCHYLPFLPIGVVHPSRGAATPAAKGLRDWGTACTRRRWRTRVKSCEKPMEVGG